MDNPTKVLVTAGIILPAADPQTTPTPARTLSGNSSSSRRPTRSSSKFLSLSTSSSRSSKSSSSPTSMYAPPKSFKKTDEPFVCPICFDDDAKLRTLSLDCDHAFCSGCWAAYITSKIRDEGEHYIRCMAEGCALVASDTFLQSVLIPEPGSLPGNPAEEEENAKVWARFDELLVRHFVSCNPNLKFCPYPSCTNTVSCPAASSKLSLTSIVPIVSCGARGIGGQDLSQSQQSIGLTGKEHKFCFGCPIESDHRPVICTVAKMWMKKCRDDSETANWIKSNTKECSQCQSTIEKNGGCK